jgi:hypothetical protein
LYTTAGALQTKGPHTKLAQLRVVQSALTAQILPSAQVEPQTPPQSVSDSFWFLTVSLQLGA